MEGGGSHPNPNERTKRENARRVFDSVDTNKDGSLDFNELQRAFKDHGLKINDVRTQLKAHAQSILRKSLCVH